MSFLNNGNVICLWVCLLSLIMFVSTNLTNLNFPDFVNATTIITPEMITSNSTSNGSSSVSPDTTNVTQRATQSDFNFAAAGDWRCNANTELTVRNIISKDPELVLSLGDMSYEDSADCWLSIMEPIDEKMKIALGNHDTEEFQGLLDQYMSHFNLTSQHYSFDHENIHFLVMATDRELDRYEENSPQYKFVIDDLAKASSNPNIDWIIVFYHNVAYTPPNNGGDGHDTLIEFHELFQRFGVDMILQGHVHAYSRTYPISFNPLYFYEPGVEYNGSNYYPNPDGQIYAIVGTGGAGFHDLFGKAYYEASQQNEAHGFLNVDVINNGLTFNATFIAYNGTVLDHFIIDKSSGAPAQEQGNFSGPLTNGTGANSLLVDLGVGDSSVNTGDVQSIVANAFASNSLESPLVTAVVEISVNDPSGETIYEFSDEDGAVLTELEIGPGFPDGVYTIEAEASAPGYIPTTETITFVVME